MDNILNKKHCTVFHNKAIIFAKNSENLLTLLIDCTNIFHYNSNILRKNIYYPYFFNFLLWRFLHLILFFCHLGTCKEGILLNNVTKELFNLLLLRMYLKFRRFLQRHNINYIITAHAWYFYNLYTAFSCLWLSNLFFSQFIPLSLQLCRTSIAFFWNMNIYVL